METSLDNLSIPAKDLLMQLHQYLPEDKRDQHTFTRSEVMKHTGWGKTKLHTHLKELIDLELVIKASGTKNSLQHYKLFYNGEGKDGRKFLIGLNICPHVHPASWSRSARVLTRFNRQILRKQNTTHSPTPFKNDKSLNSASEPPINQG
jgi:hypothetical protein